ncbi:extracellular solute-binding protein [Microbacterium esteraromaticum]|uniref:Extracellular solute-binding protein n=1 Tax=Microbacterium esteraromaticum TaxID=57043 RepID=A0A7D8A7Z9_9MICO|nr:extracellular solute-binding protein [Microbacterium esteraromaticum]QMU96840.1 extracellular solute-binding protein [Microbacterium esteraromaticum]
MSTLTRRNLLIGAGLGAASIAAVLTGCAPQGGPAGAGAGGKAAALPTYRAFTGVKPDLPGADGVPEAFYRYPSNPVAAISGKPATSPVSFMCALDNLPQKPPGNTFWAGLNDRLGADLDINGVPGADYQARLSTAIAGGQLPDLVQLNLDVPQLNQLLPRRFANLNEYLGGDAVLEYPMLANLPTSAWKNVMINGSIWGVPYPSVRASSPLFYRSDITDSLGVKPDLQDAQSFLDFCKEVTDKSASRWAIASWPTITDWVMEMFGAPNQWKVDDSGAFTRMWESESFLRGVEFLVRMHEAGVFHPDAFSGQSNNLQNFSAGHTVINSSGFMWWPNFYRDNASIAGFRVEPLLAPRHDGGGLAAKWLLNGLYTFAAINADAKPDRIKELLRVQDYLAAPFGTAEHLYRTYGAEGTHFTWADGEPVLTETGVADVSAVPVRFASGFPTAIYTPGAPEITKQNWELQKKVVEGGVELPTVGLISDSQTSLGTSLDRDVRDAISEVVQGRRKMGDLEAAVKRWRSGGGDRIADEYAAARA